MKIATEIFEKATVRGFADYLLFGLGPEHDERDYKTRLDSTYHEFEKIALKFNPNNSSDLLSSANAMTCETACVYLEIGIQAGILLIVDMIQSIQRECSKVDDEVNFCSLNRLMSEDIRKALDIIKNETSENENIKKACEILNYWKNPEPKEDVSC